MENLTAVIALAAGSLTLFAAVLKLRDEIDAKRNMALGFGAKDVLDQQTRLYILNKDVKERWYALIMVLVFTGAIFACASIYLAYARASDVNTFLIVLIGLVALACLAAGAVVCSRGREDLRDWEHYIKTGTWRRDHEL